MKQLTRFLGTIHTSPIWLRACLAIPFLTAVAVLLVTAGQSYVHAFLPTGDAASSHAPEAVAKASATNSAESRETGAAAVTMQSPAGNAEPVLVHASLGGNPQRTNEDSQRIIAPQ